MAHGGRSGQRVPRQLSVIKRAPRISAARHLGVPVMTSPPLQKSLQEIENSDWGDPSKAFSVEQRARELRRAPVCRLDADDLGFLLRQNVGMPTIAPLALESLEQNPFPESEMYPAQLLLSLMSSDVNYWHDIPGFRTRIVAVAATIRSLRDKHREALRNNETGFPDAAIGHEGHQQIAAFVAHEDKRTERKKRDDKKRLRAWWISLGGADVFGADS
jgi:hypothetical protein